MKFVTDDPVFTLGFECGQIWELLTAGETFDKKACHIENIEQITMICETYGCQYEIEVYDDSWFNLTVRPLIIHGL